MVADLHLRKWGWVATDVKLAVDITTESAVFHDIVTMRMSGRGHIGIALADTVPLYNTAVGISAVINVGHWSSVLLSRW